MAKFKRVGLIGRAGHSGVKKTLRRLLDFLEQQPVSVVLDATTAKLLRKEESAALASNELARHCDLVVVVGGDGSMLNAAKHIAAGKVPVIGVNRGRLGFLTDILPEELEQLSEVLAGKYSVEERFLLQASLGKNKRARQLGTALNDVVLHPGKAAQMIEFELFVDDQFVYSQESDGLIIATPTGSTAYALSAGGPIMHPGLNAIALVPMYPHSLSSRPIVVDGDSEIRLVVSTKGRLRPQLSCDGQVIHTASPGEEIVVRKQDVALQLIHPSQHTFYQACRSKLGWGNRLVRVND